MEQLSTRLVLSLSELRAADRPAAEEMLARPLVQVPILESAVKDAVLEIDPAYFEKVDEKRGVTRLGAASQRSDRILVGLEGDFGEASVTPRSLSADHLGRLVMLEGIVTRCSLVRPKVVRSVHYCPKTVRGRTPWSEADSA